MTISKSDIPRIYVACLDSYNSGKAHGAWIDCGSDAELMYEQIQEMLKESPKPFAEEWAIHDYENFGVLRIDEYESIEKIAQISLLIEEHGELATHVVEHVGGLRFIEEAQRLLEECYQGAYESLEDYGESYLEDVGELQSLHESLYRYFDFERYASDMELGGNIFTIEIDGVIHFFLNY